MLTYRYPLIAREGWLWLALLALIAGGAHLLLGWMASPLWLLVVFVAYLYRDPARQVPAAPLGIVSPVDGEVVDVTEGECPYLQRPAVCIRLHNALLDVHSVRSPMEGKLQQQWRPASASRRGYAQWLQSDEGDDLVLVLLPAVRLLAPRCYAHPGERVGQGQRCGYLHLGGHVEIWLPRNAQIGIEAGARVVAASDIVATLVHEKGVTAAATLDILPRKGG